MRCVVFTGAGGPEVIAIEERPDPEPGTEDVLLQVRYAGLNPADVQQRLGRYPAPPGFPTDVPGLEVSGTVDRRRPARHLVAGGRPRLRPRRRRRPGRSRRRARARGRAGARTSSTRRARPPSRRPSSPPTTPSFSQAGLRPGETLLVHGAAGGVGSAAVQLGVAGGSRVLAAVRSPENAAFVEELGAEAIPDDGFADAVAREDGRPRRRRDPRAGRRAALPRQPRRAGAQGPHRDRRRRRRPERRHAADAPDAEAGEHPRHGAALALAGGQGRRRSAPSSARSCRSWPSGRVRPLIDSEFPVDRAADAFARLEGPGKRGKVLLTFEG